MRMRRKPWAYDELSANAYVVSEPETLAGKWRELFGGQTPLHVEIGMGKGGFIIGKAAESPQVGFIGLERQISVFASAARRVRTEASDFRNIRLVYSDAGEIDKIFGENEVSQLYINFCDPWPKNRNEKRRLTHGGFLSRYAKILEPCGRLELRTDNMELFHFSVCELTKHRWGIERALTRNGESAEQRVISEYEAKFSAMGKEIYEIVASAPCAE